MVTDIINPPAASGWRWSVLLGFALIAPVGLPAGGAERSVPAVRRRQLDEPLLSSGVLTLRIAPERSAPALATVAVGEPLHVLRIWSGFGGRRWLRVRSGSACGWLADLGCGERA
ncbi:SH3 domain-containing protein [Synechococcus sp. CBW1002]|jgi:hypothetical protein|uniref:SH3 domain-containing protein n=1 Tax=Synechococcus sp. CBW1002 TaxID=1353134 RepID=UPI0018CD7A78|nr:SH3 domain-containing protein [Synechococcus sp. CBW1002]QPN60952.1 SH3 domain-containing protein [Synechococcus sp. CBW1002]